MPFTKKQKEKIIEKFKQNLEKQKSMVFVDFRGLSVPEISDLKRELKKLGAKFLVIKKTLFKIASKDVDKELSEKIEDLEGQPAVVFSFEDEIAAAKSVYNFAKKNEKLKILGGFFEKLFRDKETTIQFAQIPSKAELVARLVGSFKSPILKLDNALIYNLRALSSVLVQIK
jgi:large subunit ribosomal protein L10